MAQHNDCWLGSLVISKGYGPVLLRNIIALDPDLDPRTPHLSKYFRQIQYKI